MRSTETHHFFAYGCSSCCGNNVGFYEPGSRTRQSTRHPKAVEEATQVPACDPGQGETSGDTRSKNLSTNPNERPFGAVHEVKEGEIGIGGPMCSVPLPEAALIIEE